MKSPFPGMDPYLERHWPDVHSRLVHDAANSLQRQLGGPLRARIGKRRVMEEDSDLVRSIEFSDAEPLAGEEEAWAEEVLKAAGKR